MLLQSETMPILYEQLVTEVWDIYASLTLIEAKCIDVDQKQSIAAHEADSAQKTELSNRQWQALIALHKMLLHEHYNFFLASQHLFAGSALTQLTVKSLMSARMWWHEIHSLLKIMCN